MISFRCDYEDGACPEVMEALLRTNGETTPGYGFVCQTRTNQLFPVFPDALVERLEADFGFHRWGAAGEGRTAVRLVTSWSTQAADVEAFLQALA